MASEFRCPMCGATFPSEAALKQHGAMHMGGSGGSPAASPGFACAACGAHFATEAELKAHGAKSHPM